MFSGLRRSTSAGDVVCDITSPFGISVVCVKGFPIALSLRYPSWFTLSKNRYGGCFAIRTECGEPAAARLDDYYNRVKKDYNKKDEIFSGAGERAKKRRPEGRQSQYGVGVHLGLLLLSLICSRDTAV